MTLAGYTETPLHAPIRFFADYSKPDRYFIFLGDYAKNIAEITGGKVPEVGDKLVAINDQSDR